MATEQVVETVAESLEDAAIVTRQLNTKTIGLLAGGLGVGLVVGFIIGWRFNRAKIYAEAFAQSEEEVEKIREMYREATIVKMDDKPKLEEVIEERGYAEKSEEPERQTRPPVPIPPTVVLSEQTEIPTIKLETGKSKDLDWNYEEELAKRTPDQPYIIHEDEFAENETQYRQESLTWYAGDEILADENEDKIETPNDIVGLENLSRFGHGSGDYNVVFVRNNERQMEYEISRVPNSFSEEVLGIHDEPRE
jgi:hypothetical protein